MQGPHGSRRGAALVLRDIVDEPKLRPPLKAVANSPLDWPVPEPPRTAALAATARKPKAGFRIFPFYLTLIAAALSFGFVFKEQLQIVIRSLLLN